MNQIKLYIMIKKTLKIIGISLAVGFIVIMILGSFSDIISIPSQKKLETDRNMYAIINSLKEECPKQVGAYIYCTDVSFFNDTIRYDYEINYNEKVERYYSENPDVMKKLTSFLVVINEHHGWSSTWANLINENNYVWELRTKTPNQEFLSITFNGTELNSLLKELTSKEALQSYLDATLFFINDLTPIVYTEDGDILSDIAINKNTEKKFQLLNKVYLKEKDVIFDFSIPEIDYPISDLKDINDSPELLELFLNEMCLDPGFKEDLNIYALAKCNLVLRYYGVKSNETAEIKIPYTLIRQHTYIPPELLEQE